MPVVFSLNELVIGLKKKIPFDNDLFIDEFKNLVGNLEKNYFNLFFRKFMIDFQKSMNCKP